MYLDGKSLPREWLHVAQNKDLKKILNWYDSRLKWVNEDKFFDKQSEEYLEKCVGIIKEIQSQKTGTILYKNIDTIVGISKKVSEQLIKFIPDDVRPKIVTWYSGVPKPKIIDDDRKKELKENFGLKDEFVVCIVARVEEAKGQHIVLDAVEKLRVSGINAKALIVGHYMDQKYFEDLQKKYKNDIFTGFANNANELIQISDCKVMATRNETFGMAIMDAMRCGICVLGSDSGGPLESIDHEKTGLHFKTMDSDDLYKKLLLLANDSEIKNTLAKNGKEKADKYFDSEIQFNLLKEILEGNYQKNK
jgi:glycosyltransferase involved in cell wall biosynthesis